ncbi:hypothetical protein BTA51_01675 [Hahella sp. CCB-MM4]|uniref:hypothetical protein n=1 Tax=Hahella sp. (strain CCB-MM4) TaxID=1926491 RepID=UPI000B9AAC76|nr:hypothetical protein [Hahella sp. CCB-MM4]OZG75124.1 hypothetical protein BTA51_01675 [Hahella sp. CCB-MM4]
MKTQELVNKALSGLDYVGYQLEALGVTDKVNRHTTLAYIMAEQNHLKGELDSLNARIDQQKARVERLRKQAEKLVNDGIEFAGSPVQHTLDFLKSRLQ